MATRQNEVSAAQLAQAEKELMECRKKVDKLRREMQPEEVEDHSFTTGDATRVTLSSLFGEKNDLIVVHNMGKGCPYCTLWADGFTGFRDHLENRAALALVSPDKPEVVKEFAEGRGWNFTVLSNDGGSFTKAMGYETDDGKPLPGVSTFHRDSNGRITRVSHAPFGPGDDFCSIWHMFDMLHDGPAGWEPKYQY